MKFRSFALLAAVTVGTWNGQWFPSGRAEHRAAPEVEAQTIEAAAKMLREGLDKADPSGGNDVILCLNEIRGPKTAKALCDAIGRTNLAVVAVSGYRSYGQQASIFDRKLQKVDRQTAQRTVAPPGCSEHQLGLAMDLGTKKEIRLTAAFGDTPEGQWVAANAHRFGFIIRYKAEWEDVTGYAWEPWHIRYVGKDHAKRIFELNIPLEEYIDRQLSSFVVAEDEGESQ